MPANALHREGTGDREEAVEAAGVDEEDVFGGAEAAAFLEFVDHAVGGLARIDRIEDRGLETGQPLDVFQLFRAAQGVADAHVFFEEFKV